MIKVLHIITRLDLGGSATNTIETVARLNKALYKADLVSGKTSDPDETIIKKLKKDGINYKFINTLQREINPFLDLLAFFSLYRIIKAGSYDIVHTHSSKAGILGRWAAKVAGTKHIIHTPHGHVFYGYFSKFITAIFLLVEKFTARITDKIITLTIKGKLEHIKYGIAIPSKFVQIYSGINFSKIEKTIDKSRDIRSELNIPKESIIFGTVSRLDPIKGNDYLIEAFSNTVKSFPNAHLIIVGDGSQREELKDMSNNLHLSEKIHFLGFRYDKYDIIRSFDIFTLTSLNEGMGRAILEAMYCKKPIIASNTGGIPELVIEEKNGILTTTADTESISDAMILLAGDSNLRKTYGENGYLLANQKFSIETMIEQIEKLYKDIKNK